MSQPSVRSVLFAVCLALWTVGVASAEPIRVVMLGDSITAGLGLPPKDALPVRLEAALKERGHEVVIENAGVSGDTAEGGLARLDWATPDNAKAVIVALGANDMLRGIDPKVTRAALEGIIKRLQERKIAVMLVGMHAQRNLGTDFVAAFDAIYPDLAKKYDLVFHPFLLDGVAMEASLNQRDGIHPNAEGVGKIVEGIVPTVEKLLERVSHQAE